MWRSPGTRSAGRAWGKWAFGQQTTSSIRPTSETSLPNPFTSPSRRTDDENCHAFAIAAKCSSHLGFGLGFPAAPSATGSEGLQPWLIVNQSGTTSRVGMFPIHFG